MDDGVREQLLEAISHGATVESAAAAAGIGVSTYYRWMERGHDAAETLQEDGTVDSREEPFREFWEAATRAHARGEVFNAALLRKIAEGGYVVKSRTKRYRDPASGQVVEETETDLAPPDLRAVTFYLERRHRQGWGKNIEQLEVSGPGGGPIPMVGPGGLAALAARVEENLAEYLAELEAAEPSDNR
ncbi:hypothetical protein [Actinomadura rudentiformis]|uniref:Uncharacterized protein n=1 Tax=Actinomadura rudentiformis TaxID=359158 RepID=A0A6H9YWI9_9ACTN|nr:hypothetical protein [Actinomadura rudentiformis]KAB2351617.1 hypothetical protein F8566_05170 [Actinomadura rudentiformis]